MKPFVLAIALAVAVSLTSCGDGGSAEPAPKPEDPKPEAPKPAEEAKPAPEEKSSGEAKPAEPVADAAPVMMWVCPEAGCKEPLTPKGGACAKHPKVEKVEQLYTCSKCSSEEIVPGKCSGCSDPLVPAVKR